MTHFSLNIMNQGVDFRGIQTLDAVVTFGAYEVKFDCSELRIDPIYMLKDDRLVNMRTGSNRRALANITERARPQIRIILSQARERAEDERFRETPTPKNSLQ